MAPRRRSVTTGTSIIWVLTNTRHPLPSRLEPVADGLSQCGGPGRLLTMLAPIGGVLGVAPQRRQHLLVAVGKPHVWDDQVLAVLISEAIRQP